VIGGHGKGLLLHVGINAWSVPAVDLICVALARTLIWLFFVKRPNVFLCNYRCH
jgi:hypothetical protein